MNAKNKMLFFRDQADEANVNGIDDQLCVSADRFVSMSPGSVTTLELFFRSVKNNDLTHNDQLPYDVVTLTVTQGDIQEVMDTLVQLFNSGPHSDGFLVIADDCTITDSATTALDGLDHSSYAHPSITGVASIVVANKLHRAQLPSLGVQGATTAALADSEVCVVNTAYRAIVNGNDMDVTIPSAASGKAGDWITIYWLNPVDDSLDHTITCTTDTAFALGSLLYVQTGTGSNAIAVAAESVATENQIKITGAANGDGGVGTYVKLVNTSGTTNGWAAFCFVEKQGNGSVASANTDFAAV